MKRLIFISLFLCVFLTGCEVPAEVQESINEEAQTKKLYKYIDAEVTDIRCTWADNRIKHWQVEYISNEYGGITGTDSVSSYDSIGSGIYYGKIKVGDTVPVLMWSTVKGDEVIQRTLDFIDK